MDIYDWLNALNLTVNISGNLDPIKGEGFINVKVTGMDGALDNAGFGRSGWRPIDGGFSSSWPTVDEAMKDLCATLSGQKVRLIASGDQTLIIPNLKYNPSRWVNSPKRKQTS